MRNVDNGIPIVLNYKGEIIGFGAVEIESCNGSNGIGELFETNTKRTLQMYVNISIITYI